MHELVVYRHNNIYVDTFLYYILVIVFMTLPLRFSWAQPAGPVLGWVANASVALCLVLVVTNYNYVTKTVAKISLT